VQNLPPHYIIAYEGPREGLKYDRVTVLVHGEASRDQLTRLADHLHAGQHSPDYIEFVEYSEFAAGTPSLGEWRPGNVYGLREKDWSRRPSQEDVDLWHDFMQQEAPPPELDEDASIRRVAENRRVSEGRVREALDKVRSWLGGGTNR
jgi:hypothetical protein